MIQIDTRMPAVGPLAARASERQLPIAQPPMRNPLQSSPSDHANTCLCERLNLRAGFVCVVQCLIAASTAAYVVADMPDSSSGVQIVDAVQPGNDAAAAVQQTTEVQPLSIEELEKRLRSADFNLRQQAMLMLWGDRQRYREWVEQAVNDDDPEVARRATWVLDRWKRGLLPQLPAHIREKLQASSGPETIEYLLNYGVFSGATVAIDEAIRSGQGQAMVERAKSALRRRFPYYVRIAQDKSELPVLIELIGRLRDDVSFALAHERLLKLVPPSINATPATAANSAPARTEVSRTTQIKLMAALGQLDAAQELAKQSDEPELLRVCQMLAGNWSELMQTQLDAAATEPSGSTDFYRHWMYVLMAAARIGDTETRDKALTLLKESRGEQRDRDQSDPVNRIRWQSLALHGEVEEAGEVLRRLRPQDAAEMLATAGRFEAAFETIDIPMAELDAARLRLLGDAVRGERNRMTNQEPNATAALEELLSFCRLLVTIGEDNWARQTLRDFNAALFSIDDDARSVTRVEMIQAVTRMNRDEWIVDFIVDDPETALSDRTKFFLAVKLDSEIETVDALLDALTKLDPARSYAERMRAVTQLLLGSDLIGCSRIRTLSLSITAWRLRRRRSKGSAVETCS